MEDHMSIDTIVRTGVRPAPVDKPQQHTLGRTVGLHLLPGVLAVVMYILVTPVMMRLGYPPLFAAYLVIPATVIVFELGYLLVQGRRQDGLPSLRDVVRYREALPARQYAVLVPLLLVAAIVGSALAMPIDTLLATRLFAGAPDWLMFRDVPHYGAVYSRPLLVTTMVVGLAFNGMLGPVVEELYFRGYLLPRLERLGRWAPLLNVVLFSLYHVWTPWQFLSRIAVLTPMAYAVWWKRNIYLGVITHSAMNIIAVLFTFASLLG